MKQHFLYIFTFCAFFFTGTCLAQNVKSWTEGPLQWSDFQIRDAEETPTGETSYASLTLIKENRVVKTNGVTYKYRDVNAGIDLGQSWVRAGSTTDQVLQRHQEEFDILQFFANKYRNDYLFYEDPRIDRSDMSAREDIKQKLPDTVYLAAYKEALASYREAGDASHYPVSHDVFDITKLPYRTDNGTRYVLLSCFLNSSTGVLRQAFAPAIGFSAGFGYKEKHHLFSVELGLGGSGFETGMDVSSGGKTLITKGNYICVMGRYGYEFFSIDNSSFVVSAGVGYSDWKNGTIVSPPALAGLTLSQGIDFDLLLHRTENFLAKTPQSRDVGLRFRLSVDELFHDSKCLLSVNVSVGIAFGFRNIHPAD